MNRVMAAIDQSAAARPVLIAARALAKALGVDVRAICTVDGHVDVCESLADNARVPLDKVEGPSLDAIKLAIDSDEVVAAVIGARATPLGRQPIGRSANEIASGVEKPIMIVPPGSSIDEFQRFTVAIDPANTDMDLFDDVFTRLIESGCRLDAVHVRDEANLPRFEDQPHHSRSAWNREFAQRYGRDGVELRVQIGIPHVVVLRNAVHTHADAIVVGWTHDLDSESDDLARRLLSSSSIPVMLIPTRRLVRSLQGGTVPWKERSALQS